jgi:glycerol kinase
MDYILALDQGTTSSRAILFDRRGQVRGVAQKEFAQHFPQPGWVEHDPAEIWLSQMAVLAEVLASSGVHRDQVGAIGIGNQRETTIVWHRATGKPVCNAIVWQDRRTAGACDRLRELGREDLFRAKTGLMLDAYFSGTKVQWILDNIPGARELADAGELAFGTVNSWLVWNLTDGARHVTDASNASRTLLYNIHTGEWDDELLEILRVPRSMLPEVASSSEVVSNISAGRAAAGIPIAGIAGDQQAALFGQMCTKAGMLKNTYGTGCFMLLNTGESARVSHNRLVTSVAWRINGRTHYVLEGSIFTAGAVVQWLRDGLGIIKSASEIEQLAASVSDNGGVYFVPAFSGMGAPHWDPYARAIIGGLTRGTTAGHIARAALEGIAYQVADVAKAMQADSGLSIPELRVDGGAAANDLLMQFQSEVLNLPIIRPKVVETTALGAAYLAGLAVGFWKDMEEIGSLWEVDRRFTPVMERKNVETLMRGWHKASSRARHWAEDR